MCTVTISYDPSNALAQKLIDLMHATGAFTFNPEVKVVRPYTLEELKAGIAESERQLEQGEFCTGAELDAEVNKLIASWL